MKKTTRLTALLLALVLLLGTLSASATETGFPLEDLDMENYSTIRTTAEENAAEASSGENSVTGDELYAMVAACGDHVLCNHVTTMLQLETAQERYDYLIPLYVETVPDEVSNNVLYYDVYDLDYYMLEYVMEHYLQCHISEEDRNAIYSGEDFDYSNFPVCVCKFPYLYPAYEPGALNDTHTEATCPWKYENLSVEEKVAVVEECTSDEDKNSYFALTSEEEKASMDTYADTYGRIGVEGAELILLYNGSVLAYYDTETGILTDVRYQIPVAQVIEGIVYPLTTAE